MTAAGVAYVMGHSEPEMRRLQIQAEVLAPITRRALQTAGLEVGARVLDVGCGAGDTTMLAAGLVGPSGFVLGLDRNESVLDLARKRAGAAGVQNLSFRQGSLEALEREEPFDAVIARYVLVHQPDPAALLRAMVRIVKPGGLIFCHEVSFRRARHSYPPLPIWDQTVDDVITAFRAASSSHDAADLLARHFFDAGLAAPELRCEMPITDDQDSVMCAWVPETLRTLLPYVTADRLPEIDIDTLEQRVRRALGEVHAQIEGPAQVIAWLRTAS